jgi:membrane protease subunit (stomatin/prohibitin family)
MALIEVIKYQSEENEFVWKYPSNDLKIGSQVIVNPAQHAFFIKGGEILDEFTSGTHTLKTENIPLLNKIINLPFGGNSPFNAEIWYVNLLSKLDNKWGTTNPILLEDPKYRIVIPIRAFGQFGFKISNPRIFLETLTGNLNSFSADKVQEFFKGKIISSLTSLISKKLVCENISILEINVYLDELSVFCQQNIEDEFKKFGLEIVNFYFMSINVPLDDISVIKLKEAKDLLAKVKITGKELYQIDRNFDVLNNAAKNEGGIGTFIGAGLGLGLGSNLANQIINNKINSNSTPPPIIQYYFFKDNNQSGPYYLHEIEEFIKKNELDKKVMIWKSGMADCKVITEFDELKGLFI